MNTYLRSTQLTDHHMLQQKQKMTIETLCTTTLTTASQRAERWKSVAGHFVLKPFLRTHTHAHTHNTQ